MKVIKIFLASSIEDLALDRLHMGAFFNQLNNIYRKRDIGFELVMCEDYDNSIALGGKQEEYDREIRESELVFFLFFRKVGEYTKHEFEVALEAFKDRKKPKIVTYFKYVTSADEAAQEVQAFMQLLDQEFGHYYNTYGHIDTLKLGVLMQIKLLQLDSSEVKLQDGMVCLNEEPMVKAENVPLLHGNQTLRELTAERKRLQEALNRCRSAFLADQTPENEEAFFNASAELNRVSKQLTEVERETMELLTTVVEKTSDGQLLTHRMKEALKYFNQGDYAAVQAILSDEERENELRRAQQRADVAKNEIQGYVEEELLLIKAEKTQSLTQERVQRIHAAYKKVADLVEKHDLDKTALFDYAVFLVHQNCFEEAGTLAGKLNWCYSNPSIKVKEEQMAELYDLLGVVYSKAQQYTEAEAAYNKMLAIYTCMAKQKPETYEHRMALSCGNLGCLYSLTQRYDKAENAFDKAKEILIRLADRSLENQSTLAWIYMNLGSLYRETQRYNEAETSFVKSLEIRMVLANRNQEKYERLLAKNYRVLGNLYRETQRFMDAEKAYTKSSEILTRRAEQNPDANEPELAASLNGLGVLYFDNRRYVDAEKAFSKALEIVNRLAKRNPVAYEPSLARNYNNLAGLYNATNRHEDAERIYVKSFEIRKHLAARNPEVYEPELAESYTNLGISYSYTKKYEKAEGAFCSALEIFTRLVAQNPEVYEPDLALCYTNFGLRYINACRYDEAEETFGKASEIYTRLAARNPEVYEPKLADTIWNLFELYKVQKDTQKLWDICFKAQPLFEKLAQKYPKRYKEKSEHINENTFSFF